MIVWAGTKQVQLQPVKCNFNPHRSAKRDPLNKSKEQINPQTSIVKYSDLEQTDIFLEMFVFKKRKEDILVLVCQHTLTAVYLPKQAG